MLRATLGPIAKNMNDRELDNYVHDLLVAESMAKKQRYSDFGMDAYFDAPKPKLKMNTRFISNTVQNVHDHNRRQNRDESSRRCRDKRSRRSTSPHGRKRSSSPAARRIDKSVE